MTQNTQKMKEKRVVDWGSNSLMMAQRHLFWPPQCSVPPLCDPQLTPFWKRDGWESIQRSECLRFHHFKLFSATWVANGRRATTSRVVLLSIDILHFTISYFTSFNSFNFLSFNSFSGAALHWWGLQTFQTLAQGWGWKVFRFIYLVLWRAYFLWCIWYLVLWVWYRTKGAANHRDPFQSNSHFMLTVIMQSSVIIANVVNHANNIAFINSSSSPVIAWERVH